MEGQLATFDPKSLIVIFGARPLTSFAEGTFLTISRNDDMFKEYIGSSGEQARSKSNNRSALVKLTLIQTSDDNDYLSSVAIMDEVTNNGILPLIIHDLLGTSGYFSKWAYAKRIADASYSKEIQGREWNIFCASMNMFDGGNVPTL